MEVVREVQQSKFALKKLQQVHKFYIKIADKEIADKIVDEIFNTIKKLSHSSFIGQQEPALEKLKKDYRFYCLTIVKLSIKLT